MVTEIKKRYYSWNAAPEMNFYSFDIWEFQDNETLKVLPKQQPIIFNITAMDTVTDTYTLRYIELLAH